MGASKVTLTAAPAPATSPAKRKSLHGIGTRVRSGAAAEAADARIRERVNRSMEHRRCARELFQRQPDGQRTRVGEAEEEVTKAIMEMPQPDAALYEFRSLIQAAQHNFEEALEDAGRAMQASSSLRTESLLREARALTGLGRVDEAGNSFIRGLDRSPSDSHLTASFEIILPVVQRKRFYWPNLRRVDPEKVWDDGRTAARLPTPVLKLRARKHPGCRWEVTWVEPNDTGDDEINGYVAELSHEDPVHPKGPFTKPRVVYSGRNTSFTLAFASLRLLPHTPFQLDVRARNDLGLGERASIKDRTPAKDLTAVERAPPEDWAVIDLSDVMKDAEKRTDVPPSQQFEDVHGVWGKHVAMLRILFKFACIFGASATPGKMSGEQFINIVKVLGLFSKEFTKSDLQIIFVRANINRVDDDDSNDRPDSLLELAEFVGALTRVAAKRFPLLEKSGGLAAQASHVIIQFVVPHVRSLLEDSMSRLLEQRDVQLVLLRHRPRMFIIFGAYALGEKLARRGAKPLSGKEFAAALDAAAQADMRGDDISDPLTIGLEAW